MRESFQSLKMENSPKRRKTKTIRIGSVQVGGDHPIAVQSMANTDTRDVRATVRQIRKLEKAGCEIIRVAVPDQEAAEALSSIKQQIKIPLIADIHFNYPLAISAMKNGVDAIRINPGNIRKDNLKKIIRVAREMDIAIRIGINSGSLEKKILKKYGAPSAEALSESALSNIEFFEGLGFSNIKISVKSSDVPTMIESYRCLSRATDYPLHLGVTEAGSVLQASIKSAMGIGILLYEGIGDTIRVSITGDPVSEIPVAFSILRGLNIRRIGPEIISCPTCGRCQINLLQLVRRVEKEIAGLKEPFKIALMGCAVNGPGEAAEADIGIAGGKGTGLLFKKGKVVKKIKENEFITSLLEEIDRLK
jgi:(E)-4-hydroxy-3-methylbut-2-enyl-diphosphate synthase